MSFKCPKCGNNGTERGITLYAELQYIVEENKNPEATTGDEVWVIDTLPVEWSPDSKCACDCGYSGTYSDFTTPKEV